MFTFYDIFIFIFRSKWLWCRPMSSTTAEETVKTLENIFQDIEELPEEIGGLSSLTDLILTMNTLHELPEGIGKASLCFTGTNSLSFVQVSVRHNSEME